MLTKISASVLLLVTASNGITIDLNDCDEDISVTFLAFIAKQCKSYKTSKQFQDAFSNYSQVDAEIREINASQKTHVAGHNKFSDMSPGEYSKMLGLLG